MTWSTSTQRTTEIFLENFSCNFWPKSEHQPRINSTGNRTQTLKEMPKSRVIKFFISYIASRQITVNFWRKRILQVYAFSLPLALWDHYSWCFFGLTLWKSSTKFPHPINLSSGSILSVLQLNLSPLARNFGKGKSEWAINFSRK